MSRLPAKIQPTGNTSYLVPQTVLKAEGLVKIYGSRRVVDGVGFHVNHGEVVGLLGPNGAGKTTSFRMTCGLIDANAGVVFLNGKDVTNWPMYRRAREGGMGYLPQAESVFRLLSVQDNLLGMMEMLHMDRKKRHRRCEELLEKLKLTYLRKNLARGLSGGERRRLEIARALVSDPKIILLDEPFAAIDPITVQGIQDIIRQLSKDGISILITDHNVRETLQITHRSYVIQAGKVLCSGTPEEVLSNKEAQKVYFGEEVDLGTKKTAGLHVSSVSPPLSQRLPSFPPARSSQTDAEQPGPHYSPRKPSRSNRVEEDREDFTDHTDPLHRDYGSVSRPPRPRPSVSVPTRSERRRIQRDLEEPQFDSLEEAKNLSLDPKKPVPKVSLLGRLSGVFKKPE
ncbi:MAG: LPS export ABC transporter ATP-binding protein [Planctomycetaceae bacterium]|jgi:lipopolysaccharide export system ATP-binding protein|nr:LPS export ABC transporter ATP-binding protein [Planctomycetaceae bacterium]